MKYVDGTGHTITAADQCNMQQYLQKFAKAQGSPVVVGAIDNSPWAEASPWMARGLDFYSMDVYEGEESEPVVVLNEWQDQVVTNGYGSSVATISVTETNCKCEGSCETTYMSDRKCYFNEIASWLANQTRRGPRCFLTFWNPTGPLSGPWLPGDTATINALKNIGNGNYSTPAGC